MLESAHGVAPETALRPSEYTGALIQALHANAAYVRGAQALEVGSGSGVVLAALGRLGAASIAGVDIEPAAIACGRKLLAEAGLDGMAELHCADMWTPFAGRRFDLIVANLPHFPTDSSDFPGRLPSWSAGGPSGRRLLDPFLAGLGAHLNPDGRAFVTHNVFVDLDRSNALVAPQGLAMHAARRTLVYIPPEKFERLDHATLAAAEGGSIFRYGPYAFGEVAVVEIAAADVLG